MGSSNPPGGNHEYSTPPVVIRPELAALNEKHPGKENVQLRTLVKFQYSTQPKHSLVTIIKWPQIDFDFGSVKSTVYSHSLSFFKKTVVK